jgi:hypothetical protein
MWSAMPKARRTNSASAGWRCAPRSSRLNYVNGWITAEQLDWAR